MNKETTGEIKAIKKNLKGILVNNIWYNSFKLLEEFNIGDLVKIKYSEKDNFKNISLIELMKERPIIIEKTIKPYEKVNDTTINTLIMVIKDIYIEQKSASLEEMTEEIIKVYKKIKENL